MLIGENCWWAQHYGIGEGLVHFGFGEVVQVKDLVTEIIDLVREDAQESGCEAGLELLKTILSRGTSAHPQTAIFDVFISTGADKQSTLYSVVTFLMNETLVGIPRKSFKSTQTIPSTFSILIFKLLSNSRPISPPSPAIFSRMTARIASIWDLAISIDLSSSRQPSSVIS